MVLTKLGDTVYQCQNRKQNICRIYSSETCNSFICLFCSFSGQCEGAASVQILNLVSKITQYRMEGGYKSPKILSSVCDELGLKQRANINAYKVPDGLARP